MNIKYMEEIDTIYIYIDPAVSKIMVPSSIDDRIGVFVDRKTRKHVCGYEIQDASKTLLGNLKKLNLTLRQILGVALFFMRLTQNLSQEAMAEEIKVSLSSYKSLEKAEQNMGLDTFEVINQKFPKVKKIIGESLLAS